MRALPPEAAGALIDTMDGTLYSGACSRPGRTGRDRIQPAQPSNLNERKHLP